MWGRGWRSWWEVLGDYRWAFAANDLASLLREVGDHVVGDGHVDEVFERRGVLRRGLLSGVGHGISCSGE